MITIIHGPQCDLSGLRKWERAERLPRTDWTGETDYAAAIDQATSGQVSRQALRIWSEVTYRSQKEAA